VSSWFLFFSYMTCYCAVLCSYHVSVLAGNIRSVMAKQSVGG